MDDLTGESPTIASTLSGAGGLVAGRYRVRARLGRGATKEVYLAYDERLDREVALAIVVGAGSNAVARTRVVREAQVTGRLGDHPNVITVYDTGEIDGVPYLVLRAMGGGSLAAALARERPAIAETLRIGGAIAAALAHAHAHDVLHRDVKPDNVWLAADGTAALGDFGIAHVAGADRLTAEGVILGTVRYLSPEQIRGEPASPASDLYALGVTLYELVTGRPPFTADDPSSVLTQHLTSVPEPPSRHATLPPALEELILALLDKSPERRPQSAAAVAAALAAIAAAGPPANAASPTLATPAAPAPGAGAGATSEARRLVAVLAARVDLVDPEVLHGVYDRCAGIVEQHGGTAERYLGDVLIGVFGLTESQGDDALRAARAAVDLRATIAELRLGLDAGAVFVGSGARGATVTGAPIGAAGRLAEDAAPGEIRLGPDARAAIASLADAEIDETGRLLALRVERPALLRTPATPFVGRAHELAELHAALARVREERVCRLVTVAGPPGIGKSRLTHEFLTAAGEEATVLAGRCLSYGEGTTYRALADIVRGLGGDPRGRVEELLAGDEQAIRGLLAAIGLSDEPAHAEEMSLALRRLLERLAADRPVVVAVEDIHWAEPPLLELLDHLVALTSGVPILLVCLTRPELLESQPAWAAPQPNRSLLVLDALTQAQARELAERLGSPELAARIARRAEGNPLFVEQLVAVDSGQDTGELPASIQSVLAARIDRLEPGERMLLCHGAVEGRTFHSGALASTLAPQDRRGVAARLVALARRGLIAADRSTLAGEDAFRFTHALIREAAYAGLSKHTRAQLHAGVGEWLQQRPAAAGEIVGYHFEQACLLAAELGRTGDAERAHAARAVGYLQDASHAALIRGDAPAAIALLQRALALVPSDTSTRGTLLPALGAALSQAGRMTDATRVLDEAIVHAPDQRVAAHAQVEREFVRLETETSAGTEPGRLVGDRVLPLLERDGDLRGQCRVWSLRARIAFIAGRMAEAGAAWERAGECARRAGDERNVFDAIVWRATAALYGPTPVPEAIALCEGFRPVVAASPIALGHTLNPLAVLYAMNGEFDLARRLLAQADEILDELGVLTAHVSHFEALVGQLAAAPDQAEAALRAEIEPLESMAGASTLATTTAMLAQAVYAQERFAEADELCRATAAATAEDDIFTQVIWRGVRAKILAHQDACAEARTLAEGAVELAAATDLLSLRGDGMLDLAEVQMMCSQPQSGREALRAARALYEQKGNVVAAARARALLHENEEEV